MDKQLHDIQTIASRTHLAPAQVWVGAPDVISMHVELFLQQRWCPQNGCNFCKVCELIRQHQHHATLWLQPEKNYTVEDLTIIFDTVSLARHHDDPFFIIIQKAELLTTACANRLLKIIEEPPAGYHFILLTALLSSLLPTIRSRCVVTTWRTHDEGSEHPLLAYFTHPKASPVDFLKELDVHKLTEQEALALFDEILEYWLGQYASALSQASDSVNTAKIEQVGAIVNFLMKCLESPPMPGSSKIFCKNIYLQIQALQ